MRSFQFSMLGASVTLLLWMHCTLGAESIDPEFGWDTFSDTWVATDALGRSLPTAEQVGPPRANKFVGIFYFMWHGQHGNEGPFDISKILANDPDAINNSKSRLLGPPFALHHWGESRFGHYVSDDPAVLAKHTVVRRFVGRSTYGNERQQTNVFHASAEEAARLSKGLIQLYCG